MEDEDMALAAIDEAFSTHVGKLFEVLCSQLATAEEGGEEAALTRFSRGLTCAYNARNLARGAV